MARRLGGLIVARPWWWYVTLALLTGLMLGMTVFSAARDGEFSWLRDIFVFALMAFVLVPMGDDLKGSGSVHRS